jgi:hypothetical protein
MFFWDPSSPGSTEYPQSMFTALSSTEEARYDLTRLERRQEVVSFSSVCQRVQIRSVHGYDQTLHVLRVRPSRNRGWLTVLQWKSVSVGASNFQGADFPGQEKWHRGCIGAQSDADLTRWGHDSVAAEMMHFTNTVCFELLILVMAREPSQRQRRRYYLHSSWCSLRTLGARCISAEAATNPCNEYRSRIGPESRKLKNMIYRSVIFQSTIIKVQNTKIKST